MHWKMIVTIFRKDVWDAIRDARVLVALIVPLAIGVFYNYTFNDSTPKPTVDLAYTTADGTALLDQLQKLVGNGINLKFAKVDDAAAVRQRVENGDAALGLIIPAGFDAAVAGGRQPALRVMTSDDLSTGDRLVASAIEPALREMAAQQPPAIVQVETVKPLPENENVLDRVGLRTWAVLVAVVMMIAMIAMLAVPTILAEEVERKTLDALVMIASYADVITAKALVGVVYVVVMVPVLLGITNLVPDQPVLFAAGVLLLALSLLGFGLLLGGLFRSANQLNTWSGIMLTPLIAPAFMIGLPIPHTVETIAGLIPTGAAMKVLINGTTGEAIFSRIWAPFLVMAAWAVIAYAILLWDLSRRRG
ncbi:MAG TPA: ABC transporter permease [Thermomicrobiales bacterium]|nr:ABC transporter permease [Thermomicrobiales bacterium]